MPAAVTIPAILLLAIVAVAAILESCGTKKQQDRAALVLGACLVIVCLLGGDICIVGVLGTLAHIWRIAPLLGPGSYTLLAVCLLVYQCVYIWLMDKPLAEEDRRGR